MPESPLRASWRVGSSAVQKSGRAVEYQRQISQLENIFEEALDQSKRKFDGIDGQLTHIVDFLDAERRNKAA